MARSLNRVQLIGNLTRDPELRYTPSGAAVCTIGLATNRSWTTEQGEKKEEVEFHRLVAWNKLAELCSQLLVKGRKIYVEGRIAYRKFTKQDGTEQQIAEIVIDDMILLDSKGAGTGSYTGETRPKADQPMAEKEESGPKVQEAQAQGAGETMSSEDIADDIPF